MAGIWRQVPGGSYLAAGSWWQVPGGSRHLAAGTRQHVLGSSRHLAIWQFGIQYFPVCSLCWHGLQSVLQELASIYQYIDEISIMRKVEPIYHHYQPPASSAVRSQYGGQPINQLRASRCSILIVFAYICIFVFLCSRIYVSLYFCVACV